jgi:hypothetical protein
MRVLQHEQAADERGAERSRLARVDGDRPRVQDLGEDGGGERENDKRDGRGQEQRSGDPFQTSSSSASSARSMMKRNRADASLPISSFITRSVTI